EIETLDRIKILRGLRRGEFDVLIGINLLREGLDLPEVSLVAILDADKEGFLRSGDSLIQTIGRAARHINGRAILYADRIARDRKSTRLNSSHVSISYAVFCLKTKLDIGNLVAPTIGATACHFQHVSHFG